MDLRGLISNPTTVVRPLLKVVTDHRLRMKKLVSRFVQDLAPTDFIVGFALAGLRLPKSPEF